MNHVGVPTAQATQSPAVPENWHDDVMNRKGYAQFLTQYIAARVEQSDEPLTITLDAAWGAGKTFFVERWSKDIEANNGGVIIFDAWKNDFSVDVLVSFMAELSEGMKKLRSRVSTTGKVAHILNEQSDSVLKGFRKAALPAAAVIAKGVFAKFSGVAIEEVTNAIQKEDFESLASFDWDEVSKGQGKNFEKGLEKFFEKTLEAHKARAAAADGFKHSLELLVKTLQKEKAIAGPLYIFIDELDRCRPDYAIKLLEGVKHLFSVKGVVFVVSTNSEQLSKSVRAVYGSEFDGYGYLKRFFDFEFTLPPPDTYSFAQVLTKSVSLFEGRLIDFGLDERSYPDQNLLARAFQIVADSFPLSLRAQKQVWSIATAASTGVPKHTRISIIWLFFLSALKHSHPKEFEKYEGREMQRGELQAIYQSLGTIAMVRNHQPGRTVNGFRSPPEEIETSLTNILDVYHQAAHSSIDKIYKMQNNSNTSPTYPSSLMTRMVEDRPNPFNSNTVYYPYIRNYYALVKLAGLIA